MTPTMAKYPTMMARSSVASGKSGDIGPAGVSRWENEGGRASVPLHEAGDGEKNDREPRRGLHNGVVTRPSCKL
jgi:hypothetical protein